MSCLFNHQFLSPSDKFRSCLRILGMNWQTSFKTFGNVKFSQKTKVIFQRLGILMVFQISYCISSSISTSPFLFQMAVSRYLATSVICCYQSLLHSSPHQTFGSYFLVFRKCGVTPQCLYDDSLTLTQMYSERW